jgi:hypothetical protein
MYASDIVRESTGVPPHDNDAPTDAFFAVGTEEAVIADRAACLADIARSRALNCHPR